MTKPTKDGVVYHVVCTTKAAERKFLAAYDSIQRPGGSPASIWVDWSQSMRSWWADRKKHGAS